LRAKTVRFDIFLGNTRVTTLSMQVRTTWEAK